MSTSDYITYTALFVAILATQLGTRRPTIDRLLMPVLIVVAIGFKYLRALPSGSTAHLLELGGVAVGVLFGVASIPLFKVAKNAAGCVVTRSGAAYAALWISALAGRLVFAFGSTHWFHGALVSFSIGTASPPRPTAPPSC